MSTRSAALNAREIRAGRAHYDYTVPILMLVVLGGISIFLSIMLKRADKEQGYGLELPSGVKPEASSKPSEEEPKASDKTSDEESEASDKTSDD